MAELSRPTADDGLSIDALRVHVAAPIDWFAPPARCAAMLAAASGVAYRETGAQEHYLEWIDIPAHEGDRARGARYLEALAKVRALADECAPLDWPALRGVQGMVLGSDGPAPFRAGPAFSRGGRVVHGFAAGLEETFAARLERDGRDGAHPIVRAVRGYLDVIWFHPFADGNARCARLVLEHALRIGRVPTPALEPLVRLPKPPGREDRAWDMVRLIARGVLRVGGVCPASV